MEVSRTHHPASISTTAVKHLNLTADRFGDIVDENGDLVVAVFPPSIKRPNWDLKEVSQLMEAAPDMYRALDHLVGLINTIQNVYGNSTTNWIQEKEPYQLAVAALRRARGEK